jgi:protein-arginine kinase activator protein McsA
MASVQFKGFDMDKLLRKIQKDVKQDLQEHPEIVLDSHVGQMIEGNCPNCGRTTIEILTKGKARCTECGHITEVDLQINYK